jgi:hypothetical protein
MLSDLAARIDLPSTALPAFCTFVLDRLATLSAMTFNKQRKTKHHSYRSDIFVRLLRPYQQKYANYTATDRQRERESEREASQPPRCDR